MSAKAKGWRYAKWKYQRSGVWSLLDGSELFGEINTTPSGMFEWFAYTHEPYFETVGAGGGVCTFPDAKAAVAKALEESEARQ